MYHEIDSLFTLFKHRYQSSFLTSRWKVLIQPNRTVQHNLRWKGAEKMPSIAKKPLIWKNYKRHYLISNQKLASTQIYGSAFPDTIRNVQNWTYESDFLKIIDCFIDCHDDVNSDYISFVIKLINCLTMFT